MDFPKLEFRFPWRPYQKRVLNAIEQHLSDKRLHIVAAPGAGKTSLGLEVFNRLGKKAMVLSPTRVIRDQWLTRLADFESAIPINQIASNDLLADTILISTTYQAVYAKSQTHIETPSSIEVDENEIDEDSFLEDSYSLKQSDGKKIAKIIKKSGIQVLILDEAHHLRSAWWKVLDEVSNEVADLVIVSLTATPPYDSGGNEWNRYETLCGPIDEEISVPELVKNGNLCPHQDYIWTVPASSLEIQKVREYDKSVQSTCEELFFRNDFEETLLTCSFLSEESVNLIDKDPLFTTALLVFLKAKGIHIADWLMNYLDLSLVDIPDLNRYWWQILIEGLLFSKYFPESEGIEEFRLNLKGLLKGRNLLIKREVCFERSRRMDKLLSQSSSKVEACLSLHKLETKERKNNLRQVFLFDYIRDEEINLEIKSKEVKLGACPVFLELIKTSIIPDKIALITGRLIVVPQHLSSRLSSEIKCQISVFDREESFVQVKGPTSDVLMALTNFLNEGLINVLVGTRSLLGEGWDAPSVNSLVIASSVGSYMLSNQMRGRAIRIDSMQVDKVSSIWHLAAIDDRSESGMNDVLDLRRRFETFVGLSEKDVSIENGFERMDMKSYLLYKRFETKKIAPFASNKIMLRRFKKRNTLIARWKRAVEEKPEHRIIPSVSSEPVQQYRRFYFRNTVGVLLAELVSVGATSSAFVLSTSVRYPQQALTIAGVIGAAFSVWLMPKAYRLTKMMVKHYPVDGSLKQIGEAVLHSLLALKLISTPEELLELVMENREGHVFIALRGGSFYESSLFADCIKELLSPIDKPRYIIQRKENLRINFTRKPRIDFHSVPTLFGNKKERAEVFHQNWEKYVSPAELVYTQNEDGRKFITSARVKAFSSFSEDNVKRINRWV